MSADRRGNPGPADSGPGDSGPGDSGPGDSGAAGLGGRDLSDDGAGIAALLAVSRTIAVVGASADPGRPSHGVALALANLGYRVLPVNPSLAGQTLFGQPVAATLADLAQPVDIVDIFRRSDAAGAVIDEAIGLRSRLALRAVWLQLGVHDAAACGRALAAGLAVVTGRCLKIDAARLGVARPGEHRGGAPGHG